MASYNRLATLMGEHQELAVFRRFQTLNAKSLLYMQAEILHLGTELKSIELEDQKSKDIYRASLHTSLFNLKESFDSDYHLQWSKATELRDKLKRYNQSLLLFSQVQALPTPCVRDLGTLKQWLDRPDGGDFFLQGREAEIWDDERDVLTLSRHQAERDIVTAFINDVIIPWYHGLRCLWDKSARKGDGSGVWHYEYRSMIAIVNVMSTILASLLPSTSILILYLLERPIARLAAIMVFTAVFSSTLVFFTKARRVDVFAATTAFAAVQAVFVGGSGLNSAQVA